MFHSMTKTREEKDLTLGLKLEKDMLNLEDIMNSTISELTQSSLNNFKKIGKTKVGKCRA